MTSASSATHADISGEADPEFPDPNFPNDDEPDSSDDIDALVDDIAAAAPIDRDAIIEVEAALSYVHERLDEDALAVLGLALDRLAERHLVVLRHVARSVASLQAERRRALFDRPPSRVTSALEAT
jgi:hypothetical protein